MPASAAVVTAPSSALAALVQSAVDPATRAPSAGVERVVADLVGAIAGGYRAPEMRRLRERLAAYPPVGDGSALLGAPNARAAPETAAFANATAGCWLELDEGTRPTGHPAVHVVPAALAVAESVHASGARLLAAVTAGYEVTARLFAAFVPKHELHPHGSFGAIGAAVAAADLLDADCVCAAGIAAATPLAPMWSACLEGGTSRNAYAGHASALGVRAAYLAAAGFTPAGDAFDDAFSDLLGHFELPPQPLGDGEEPAHRRNYFKFHSACVLVHSAVDAALNLGPVDSGEIRGVTVDVPSAALRVRDLPALNDLSIRFSLPYAMATALLLGAADERAMTVDAGRLELAGLVDVRHDPDMDAAWPAQFPARVVVRTAQAEHSAVVTNHHGHHLDPPTPAELRDKFARLTAGTVADGRFEQLAGLNTIPDVAELFSTRRSP
jgi:2-methylcitrate dehydratase PrpD